MKYDFYLGASYNIYKHTIKEILISPNGQQSTEYLVKYLGTTGPAITKLLSHTENLRYCSKVKCKRDEGGRE